MSNFILQSTKEKELFYRYWPRQWAIPIQSGRQYHPSWRSCIPRTCLESSRWKNAVSPERPLYFEKKRERNGCRAWNTCRQCPNGSCQGKTKGEKGHGGIYRNGKPLKTESFNGKVWLTFGRPIFRSSRIGSATGYAYIYTLSRSTHPGKRDASIERSLLFSPCFKRLLNTISKCCDT